MTATRTEVVTNALRVLKVVNSGMDASADDFELVAKVYDGLHTRLSITGKIWWPESDCVPDEVYGPISSILAAIVVAESSDFGLDPNEKAEVQFAHDKGLIDIL